MEINKKRILKIYNLNALYTLFVRKSLEIQNEF